MKGQKQFSSSVGPYGSALLTNYGGWTLREVKGPDFDPNAATNTTASPKKEQAPKQATKPGKESK